jgi:hypothetical protein
VAISDRHDHQGSNSAHFKFNSNKSQTQTPKIKTRIMTLDSSYHPSFFMATCRASASEFMQGNRVLFYQPDTCARDIHLVLHGSISIRKDATQTMVLVYTANTSITSHLKLMLMKSTKINLIFLCLSKAIAC